MRWTRALCLPCCLGVLIACQMQNKAVPVEAFKCSSDEDCAKGTTCYDSRCLTKNERRVRERKAAAEAKQASGS